MKGERGIEASLSTDRTWLAEKSKRKQKMQLNLLRARIAPSWFTEPVGTERERVKATPSLRPPSIAGEPRKRPRHGSVRGKVTDLPAIVAFARNEGREGRRGLSCCG
ncbi:hypothetical protein JCGZ_00123 [Jatropha curcas]|uniref:Uncharacterized protein n=1 Tax=Jatropha curcas TaxID=180498 RepID=A0A067JIL4_JATCU|nr:hypothetical protein JCGZ_00123 [Jatropha curcas]